MKYIRGEKKKQSQKLEALEKDRIKSLQLKILQALPTNVICNKNPVQASRFVHELLDFRILHNIDEELMYTYIKTPTRLSVIIYNAWVSVDDKVIPQTFISLMKWIYHKYVGEYLIHNIKKELYVINKILV
jgi:hypothetical protein